MEKTVLADVAGEAPEPPGADRSVSLGWANGIALALVPAVAGAVVVPYGVLHGWEPLGRAAGAGMQPLVFIPLLLVSIVVHEALHGVGFLLAGAPRAEVRFGLAVRTLTPYATCRRALPVRGYRLAAALPALVLGVLPAAAGWVGGSGELVLYAAWMLLMAGGDLLILWLVRDLPPSTHVTDHPERAGCRIVPAPEARAQH